MRKFELVDGSFQEQGASKWRTWWSRWSYYKRFGLLKGWKMLKLREELLAVEEDRMHGSKGYSVDEVAAMMRSVIKEATGRGKSE